MGAIDNRTPKKHILGEHSEQDSEAESRPAVLLAEMCHRREPKKIERKKMMRQNIDLADRRVRRIIYGDSAEW